MLELLLVRTTEQVGYDGGLAPASGDSQKAWTGDRRAIFSLQFVVMVPLPGDAIEVPRAAAMSFVSIFTPLERFVARSWHSLSKNSVRASGGADDNYQCTPCSSAPPFFKTAAAFEFDPHTVKYSQKVTESGSFFSEATPGPNF